MGPLEKPVVSDRLVFTFTPKTWPDGLISGYLDAPASQVVVEHVVSFRRGGLPAMIRAGLVEVQKLGASCVLFYVPDDFPFAGRLARLAERLGALPYAHKAGVTWYRLPVHPTLSHDLARLRTPRAAMRRQRRLEKLTARASEIRHLNDVYNRKD